MKRVMKKPLTKLNVIVINSRIAFDLVGLLLNIIKKRKIIMLNIPSEKSNYINMLFNKIIYNLKTKKQR